jgi:hypothetical protein
MRKIGVSGADGAARLNVYRAGLSAPDWGEVTRARLEGPGPQVNAPTVRSTATPADRSLLTLPYLCM